MVPPQFTAQTAALTDCFTIKQPMRFNVRSPAQPTLKFSLRLRDVFRKFTVLSYTDRKLSATADKCYFFPSKPLMVLYTTEQSFVKVDLQKDFSYNEYSLKEDDFMLKIGCHLSVARGFTKMGEAALSINANTLQFFTRNPRGSKAREFNEKDADGLIKIMKENGFETITAHAPYTYNLCSADPQIRQFAGISMAKDLISLEYFDNVYYNFHPGSHVGQGTEKGIDFIADALNRLLLPSQKTTVLLETMAGKGSEIGSRFEEIKSIIDKVDLKEKLGVCIDTCHIFDAGYDIVNNLDGVLEKFDAAIGLEKLRAVHLNDSLNTLGSRKDRHARISEGNIGLDAMIRIINHPKLKNLPFILETPNELDGYAKEIEILRKNYNG